MFQPASEFLPMIDEVYRSLIEITKDIAGSNIENNKFCISVHYRNVDEKVMASEIWFRVYKILTEILLFTNETALSILEQ